MLHLAVVPILLLQRVHELARKHDSGLYHSDHARQLCEPGQSSLGTPPKPEQPISVSDRPDLAQPLPLLDAIVSFLIRTNLE
jgi:hypothetical protein